VKRAWEHVDPTKRYKVSLEDGRKAIEKALSSFKSKNIITNILKKNEKEIPI